MSGTLNLAAPLWVLQEQLLHRRRLRQYPAGWGRALSPGRDGGERYPSAAGIAPWDRLNAEARPCSKYPKTKGFRRPTPPGPAPIAILAPMSTPAGTVWCGAFSPPTATSGAWDWGRWWRTSAGCRKASAGGFAICCCAGSWRWRRCRSTASSSASRSRCSCAAAWRGSARPTSSSARSSARARTCCRSTSPTSSRISSTGYRRCPTRRSSSWSRATSAARSMRSSPTSAPGRWARRRSARLTSRPCTPASKWSSRWSSRGSARPSSGTRCCSRCWARRCSCCCPATSHAG